MQQQGSTTKAGYTISGHPFGKPQRGSGRFIVKIPRMVHNEHCQDNKLNYQDLTSDNWLNIEMDHQAEQAYKMEPV